jgi:hypothetical protein
VQHSRFHPGLQCQTRCNAAQLRRAVTHKIRRNPAGHAYNDVGGHATMSCRFEVKASRATTSSSVAYPCRRLMRRFANGKPVSTTPAGAVGRPAANLERRDL